MKISGGSFLQIAVKNVYNVNVKPCNHCIFSYMKSMFIVIGKYKISSFVFRRKKVITFCMFLQQHVHSALMGTQSFVRNFFLEYSPIHITPKSHLGQIITNKNCAVWYFDISSWTRMYILAQRDRMRSETCSISTPQFPNFISFDSDSYYTPNLL